MTQMKDDQSSDSSSVDSGRLKRSMSMSSVNSARLTNKTSQQLRNSVSAAEDLHTKELHAHDAHHGHKEKKPSIVSAVISGFVNYLLMFGLCCAYGMIMFTDDFNGQHRALGVKLNLLTSFLAGIWCSVLSKVPVAIGGPDLNPVVFLGLFVNVMSESIASNVGLSDFPGTEGRRLDQDGPLLALQRRLGGGGGGGGIDWCTKGGSHIYEFKDECLEYHEKLRATTIFCVMVSSAILGTFYFVLGKFKITRFVSYVPTSVQEAFLSCIGYKVFKYALLFCNYQPLQFIPAACIGVTLYFFKAMHIGNPAVMIPVMTLLPLGIFHGVVGIAGLDINTMRTTGATDNWMFPELTHCDFWELWTDSYGKYDKIDFKAWMKTLPDLASMIVVCLIDCLLKISSTESKLPVKVDKDYECTLHGAGNFLTTITGSSVGYMQLKFNVINFGVLGNIEDRRGGIVYALLCGACFFGTIGHFNYLPRFFLGILLFLAGSGFVAENLWGSRKHLSFAEWSEILVILAVFIFSGSLVAAVLCGVLLTCLSLILKYAKISCVAGRPLNGGQITSCVRSNPLLERQLRHFADSWFVVIRLKGFIFFASAQALVAKVMKLIQDRQKLHGYRHLKYIILDCELLDGMDASAGKSIRKMRVDADKAHCKVLWSDVNTRTAHSLLQKEMIANVDHAFPSLDTSILYIEYGITEYMKHMQRKWLEVDGMFKLQHNLARFEHEQDPWGPVLLKFTARRGCPWQYCTQERLEACATILWHPGDTEQGLFLIHSGKVALFAELPSDDAKDGAWSNPLAVYPHGWFMNREFVIGMPTKHYAVAIDSGEVLFWTKEQWWKMFAERPNMAAEIWRAVASQQSLDSDRTHALLDIGSMHVDDFHEKEEDEEMDEDEEEIEPGSPKWNAASAAEAVGAYDEEHRSHLPDQLKFLIDSFEVADAFGEFGVYQADQSDLSFLPPLPQSILSDLIIAFNTYAVARNGVNVLPADQTMAALAYAGVQRAAIVQSEHEFFTKDEFIRLGHEGSMSRVSSQMATKLQEVVQKEKKKQGYKKSMKEYEFSELMIKTFHASLTEEVVHGLLEEIGKHDMSDENVFVSMCSRLFRWHEQYYSLLVSVRTAAREDPEEALSTVTTFSTDRLAKLMGIEHTKAAEMLWACDWPRVNNTNKFGGCRHVYDVALCVICTIAPPTGNMHPPPVLEDKSDNSKPNYVDGKESYSEGVDVSDLMLNFSNTGAGSHAEIRSLKIELPHLEEVEEEDNWSDKEDEEEIVIPFKDLPLRQRIHLTLEEPTSSRVAFWIGNVMGVFIMMSVATLFCRPIIEHGRDEDDISKSEDQVWFIMEAILTGIFTLEYVIRVACANAMGTQTTFRYIITPSNICDFAAILPFYIELAMDQVAQAFRLGKVVRGARVMRLIRLLRLARVARVARLAKRTEVFAPIAMCLLVIWGTYMKNGLSDK
mmetsp:Transcript_62254/g.114355  ORF Transcript_62254/g.114355 Transcript_62254/m.114355 type:complete len:1451 (-) Transcript_62254:247-4599(-)